MGRGRPDGLGLAAGQATEDGAWPSGHDEQEALTALCRLVTQALHADDASIGILRGGRLTTGAATSERARLAEQALELGDPARGPASVPVSTIRMDQQGDGSPWAVSVERVGERLGIGSVMVHVVRLGGSGHAVLAVYASRPSAFTADHAAMLSSFGTVAVAVIGSDLERHRAAHLQRAVHTNRRIGAAIGVVMATQRVDVDEAWQVLSAASQGLNVKVAEVAEQVICTGALPGADGSRTALGT